MSAIGNSRTVLTAAVANGGTVTLPYPTGLTQADINNTTGGKLALNDNDVFPQAPSGAGTVAFSFGASNITVTNNTGISWPVGATVIASYGRADDYGRYTGDVKQTPAITNLTAATGTASDTIADVGASFTQATLNNNFKSLADKMNALTTLLRNAGVIAN